MTRESHFFNHPESDLPDVRIVSFDVWMTLIRSHPEYKRERARVIGSALNFSGDLTEVTAQIRQVDIEMEARSEAEGAQYGFAERIHAIQEHMHGYPSRVSQDMIATLEGELAELLMQYPPLLLEDDLPDTLKQLKERGKLAIVSNTGLIDGRYMRFALDLIGIREHLATEIYSNEAGVAKPNPKIFDLLAQEAQVDTAQILHIGDNMKADYRGGQSAGVNVLHYSQKPQEEVQRIASIRELLRHIA